MTLISLAIFFLASHAFSYRNADYSNIRCTNSTLPTPTNGIDGALFTVCTEQLIRGSMSNVYDAIIDFPKYSIWNSFVISVSVPSNVISVRDVYVGIPMQFTTAGTIPFFNTSSSEVIKLLSPGSDFAIIQWGYDDGLNGTVLAAGHPNILTDVGSGLIRYVSYETFYLPGALLVVALEENLQKQFDQQGKDLKAYVESQL